MRVTSIAIVCVVLCGMLGVHFNVCVSILQMTRWSFLRKYLFPDGPPGLLDSVWYVSQNTDPEPFIKLMTLLFASKLSTQF